MVALRNNNANASETRQWWHNARQLADEFFRLIDSRPTSTPNAPLLSIMVSLHTAGQKLSRLTVPADCHSAQQYLLNAMRYLQLSMAEIVAQNPQNSDAHYDRARVAYQKFQRALNDLGFKQVD